MAQSILSPRSQAQLETGDDGTRQGSIVERHPPTACAGCGKAVEDGKTAVAVKALGKQWHKECFTCSQCKARIGHQFNSQNGLAYCDPCYNKVAKSHCPKCQQAVVGHFVKALGAEWHKECFVCTTCQKPFTNNKFEGTGTHAEAGEIGEMSEERLLENGKPYHEGC